MSEQAEVFVFSQKYSRFGAGQREDYFVHNARIDLCDCRDIVAGFAESGDDSEVAALVGEKPHRLVSIGDAVFAYEDYLFVGECIRGVAHRRVDVLPREARIGVEKIRLRGAFAQLRRMSSTGIRVPRITGLPSITRAFTSMRSVSVMVSAALRSGYTRMRKRSSSSIAWRTAGCLLFDALSFILFGFRSRAQLAAEKLFLRQQFALYTERRVRSRRADAATRITLVVLARLIDWRAGLTIVKPETLIRWHRKGFRLFWRWKSKARGRPRLARRGETTLTVRGVS